MKEKQKRYAAQEPKAEVVKPAFCTQMGCGKEGCDEAQKRRCMQNVAESLVQSATAN